MIEYKKSKNSGIEWIGEIPDHWDVKKLKYENDLIMGQSPNSSSCNQNKIGIPFLQGNAEFGLTFPEEKNWCDEPKKIVKENDILVSVRAPIGAVNIANKQFGIGRGLCAIRSKSYKYQYYLSLSFSEELESLGTGSTFKAVSTEQVENLFLPIPHKNEQTAIANYLDRKTAEIDELIAKKEKLLTLYEEEKTAVINSAVTGRILMDNGELKIDNYPLSSINYKFKPSGVEWLGDPSTGLRAGIPAHWEVKKLKYVANASPSNIDKKSKDNEDEIYLCNYVDVYNNDFISSEMDFMKATASKNQIEKFILNKGDVIATKDSETPDDIGNPALVTQDFDNVVCGYHLTHIKPKTILGEYLFRLIQSKIIQSYFEVSANGVTRYGLSVDKFNSVLVLIPPTEEQTAIVAHIEKESARIDAKITKTKKLIELLKEYRAALISEAVTGKIKII
jgi:type I restriction enzyme S subunit